MAQNFYTSKERLYLNKQGEVVGAKDPSRVELLIHVGGTMPLAKAKEFGLVESDASETEATDATTTKARGSRTTNKPDNGSRLA